MRVFLWPVAINAAGVDVVRALDATDGLQANTSGLKRHDVDQAVLKLVAGQVGADEPWRVSFGVGQSLFNKKWEEVRQGQTQEERQRQTWKTNKKMKFFVWLFQFQI